MSSALSRRDRGVTLIELVLAVLILSIGALAAFRVSDAAQRSVGQQEVRLIAQQVALNRAAELKLIGMAEGRTLPSTVEMGRFHWRVAVDESVTELGLIKATIIVTGRSLPGSRLVTFVPPEAAP